MKLWNEEFAFGFFKKRNLLVFFTVMAMYTGLSLGNTFVFLFGVYCLILLLVAFIISYFSAKGIRCRRSHLSRTFEGTEVDVHISLENDSFYPLYMVEIRDVFLPGESYYVNILAQYKIDTNHFVDLDYKGKCIRHRGLYTLGPIITHSSDPLGIIPIRHEIPVITDLMVYPRTKEIKEMVLYELGTLFNVGQQTTINSGVSAEFSGVREYRYGDSVKHIHWGLSAKHNKLIIKEFEETVVTDVSIFVDLYRYSHTGIGDVSTLEYAVKVAASIAELAVENSHQVQVFAMGLQGGGLLNNNPLTPFNKGDNKPLTPFDNGDYDSSEMFSLHISSASQTPLSRGDYTPGLLHRHSSQEEVHTPNPSQEGNTHPVTFGDTPLKRGLHTLNPSREGNIYDVPLGAGYSHLITVLDKLTFYRIGTVGSFEDEFIEKVGYVKRGSTVVLVICSSNFKLEKILNTLRELITNRVRIICVIINDRTFIKVWKGQDDLQRDAMPIGDLERILKENGCIVYVLKKDDDIGMELSKSKRIISRGRK